MVEEEEEEEEEAMDAALMALGGPGTAIKRRAIKLDGFGAAVAAAACVYVPPPPPQAVRNRISFLPEKRLKGESVRHL